ncbi:hypothetical protein K450DRAFT_248974 [Umbelopsis ramanniana AG]|uniref:FZ domain-containing protein n=1 Tax=Umbelopsis ramanniana AG TaxID=1314678 RepID=A0AAD5E857_UMBRA|nr:uncharacterized protein K450DRAFT_248974 [Umbelopsis ramanniana AG]KAI8578090.1 hypothetical protein K450DRAFT_248974 [Umbelopsis ramanniana AG]
MQPMLLLGLPFLLFFPCITSAQNSVTVALNNSQIVNNVLPSGGIQHYFFDSNSQVQQPTVAIPFITTAATPHASTSIASSASVLPTASVALHARRLLPRAGSIAAIYLTVTVCSQPQPPSSYEGFVPPLQVFVSTTSTNSLPGPNVPETSPLNTTYSGFTSWNSTLSPTTQLWVGVSAPALANGWTGNWTYQIGTSTIAPMHELLIPSSDDSIAYMTLDDSDNNNALFLTSSYQGSQAPNFTVLITTNPPQELAYSICAAQKFVQSHPVNYTMTARGPFNATRQQAYVSGLSPATRYTAYLMQPRSNNLPAAYGPPISFSTKSELNCRLIYGLSFCDQVAYSVATNPNDPGADIWNLTQSYDQNAVQVFQPFATALSQFNCDTTQYSLVRNCTDCYNDYKNWMCSVLIPRCTTPSPFNQENDMNDGPSQALHEVPFNQSRNPWIDSTYSPNQWTELLPCVDLCYRVVQSCPPFMQFNCPSGDIATSQYGYWQTGTASQNGTNVVFDINNPTCNRMGLNTSLLVLSGALPSLSIPSSFYAFTVLATICLFI